MRGMSSGCGLGADLICASTARIKRWGLTRTIEMTSRYRHPTPEQALDEYRDIVDCYALERGKLDLALEIAGLNWHLDRVDAGVREPDEPDAGPALDFENGVPLPPKPASRKRRKKP